MPTLSKAFMPARINILDGGMRAQLELFPRESGLPYTKSEVLQMLHEREIRQGIDQDMLDSIVREQLYEYPYVIARGKDAIDGEDGHFEYYFRMETERKPKIREDGSVDYGEMDLFERVTEGQVLAKYIHATAGIFGYWINGKLRKPKPGREQPALKGTGFRIEEDGCTYVATENGGVAFQNGKLMVSNTYTFEGDLTVGYGNINFEGDVHIKGDVIGNAKIFASGSILVDGNIESSYLNAGKDILLKNGMKGYENGTVIAGGSVFGTYFEYTTIRCAEMLECNYLLGCDAYSNNKIKVYGKNGAIVGGNTQAVKGIEVENLGNKVEIKTKVTLGVSEKFLENYENTKKQYRKVKEDLILLENGKNKYGMDSGNYKEDVYKKICIALEIKQEEMEQLELEYRNGIYIMAAARHARLRIAGILYSGTIVKIQGCKCHNVENRKSIEVSGENYEIVIRDLHL